MATQSASHIDRSSHRDARRWLRIPPALTHIWEHPVARVSLAMAIPAIAGVFIALVRPRGPLTASGANLLMITGFAGGLAAGFVMGSRWAMLLAPVAHIIAFEVARIGADGPTVDGIHLGSTFGILAFLLGRGVYFVLGILPMILGVAYGASIARWVLSREMVSTSR